MSTTTDDLLLDEYGEVIEITDWRHPDFDPTDAEMQPMRPADVRRMRGPPRDLHTLRGIQDDPPST